MKFDCVFKTAAALCIALGVPSLGSAQLIAFQSGQSLVGGNSLSGNVTYEGWDELNTSRISNPNATGGPAPGEATTRPYGSHNNTEGWYNWAYDSGSSSYVATTPATIASNLGSGGSTLWKSGGYGYIASSSVHQGFPGNNILPGGNFVLSSSAIAGLETIVFQLQATDRGGDATTLGSVLYSAPTLSFGATTLSATYSSLFDADMNYSSGGFGTQNMQYLAFQWDLSGYDFTGGETLTINFTGLTNSGIFGLQINQSDVFTQVVPEPSTYALMLLGLALMAVFHYRRREGKLGRP